MKNIQTIIILSLISQVTLVAQIASNMENDIGWIEVTYRFKVPEKNETVQLPAHTKEMTQRVDRLIETIEFKLRCNRTKSVFATPYAFDNSDLVERVAETIVDGTSTYYVDVAARTSLIEKKQSGEALLLIDNLDLSWEIQDTTTEINGLTCRFATGRIKTPGFSDEVVSAWFTSTYPVPFGPRNLHGLPGLVVQGQIGKMVYTATTIRDIKDQKYRIHIPKWNEKTMLLTEYYKELKKIAPSPPKSPGGE